MHDPESPHFVIGSTRNTNSTMLLYRLAQLVGDKTFGILKELRRFFLCVCVICLQTSAKLLGRFKPCFPKLLCVGITTNQSRCKTIVSIIDPVKMKKILKGHSIETLILLPAGTKNQRLLPQSSNNLHFIQFPAVHHRMSELKTMG